jgi:hypothetical protein
MNAEIHPHSELFNQYKELSKHVPNPYDYVEVELDIGGWVTLSDTNKPVWYKDCAYKIDQEILHKYGIIPKPTSMADAMESVVRNSSDKNLILYNHYYKNTQFLDFIDVYRVLDLFKVTDPCSQHAIKKLLCAGDRGAKDYKKDITEARDTLNRQLEMMEEDDG